MGVIVLNTYAGSLLLGAKAAGLPVEYSLEDCGFGQKWARKNFPDIKHMATPATWPDDEPMRDRIAIAHPPCAGFSLQSRGQVGADKHGLNSPHLEETRLVVNYALGGLEVKALAIESVCNAAQAGAPFHEALAEEHGYHLFRLFQNAATFGVPQWRPRFWAIFVRKDVADRMAVWHTPKVVKLKDVLTDEPIGEAYESLEVRLAAQRKHFEEMGWDADALLNTPGGLAHTLRKLHLPDMQVGEIAKTHLYGSNSSLKSGPGYAFVSKTPRVLDPEGTAHVLIDDCWWLYKGRNITPYEWRLIMGFPGDYVLQEGKDRLYLSKGVVPQVATWVLQLMSQFDDGPPVEGGVRWLRPGEIADFRVTHQVWQMMADGDIEPSRAYDELPKAPKTTRGPRTTIPVTPRKRRVIRSYYFICPDVIPEDLVRQAFEPKKDDLVCHPLHSLEDRDDGFRAVIQYEPPNIGGHRGDVERIAKRVARKLEEAGYSVEYTDEGPVIPRKEDA